MSTVQLQQSIGTKLDEYQVVDQTSMYEDDTVLAYGSTALVAIDQTFAILNHEAMEELSIQQRKQVDRYLGPFKRICQPMSKCRQRAYAKLIIGVDD